MIGDKITLLCPTRGRPEGAQRMISSAVATSRGSKPVEILLGLDDDDDHNYEDVRGADKKIVFGEGASVGYIWNKLATEANGDFLMMANDDLVFQTQGWDETIMEELDASIPHMVWVNDGSGKSGKRCAFPIVTIGWLRALGYFTPECFNFLYHDTWVHDIAMRASALTYIPHVLIEHMHFTFDKAEMDDTYRRHRVGKSKERNEDAKTFNDTADVRQKHAGFIKNYLNRISKKEDAK